MQNLLIMVLIFLFLSITGHAFAKDAEAESKAILQTVELKVAETPEKKLAATILSPISKLEKRIDELESQKLERDKSEVERNRKSIDWWFSALAIMTTLVAIIGAFLPYLMGRKDKERLESELQEARRLTTEASRSTDKANILAEEARGLVDSIREQHLFAEKTTTEITKYKDSVSGKETTEAEQQESTSEVNEAAKFSLTSDIGKLKVRAVAASQFDNPSTTQALEAFDLWKALSVIDINNDSAQFNAGYWASQLADMSTAPSEIHWLSIAKRCYAISLEINPKKHEAANNWGISLYKEANEVAKTNLKAAQTLWKQAGEKYALALSIKANKHATANNWGLALSKEADEVAKTDVKAGLSLWQEAGEKYALALSIKPDKHEAANNWGIALLRSYNAMLQTDQIVVLDVLEQAQSLLERHSLMDEFGRSKVSFNLASVYGLQSRASEAVVQLEICRVADKLPRHWRLDTDLDPIRSSDEYKTWYKTHFGDDKT